MPVPAKYLSLPAWAIDLAAAWWETKGMGNYHGMEIAWANRLVQTARVDFGRVKYTPGGYCGPRRQRDYQLVVIEVGGAEVEVDKETLPLRPEQAAMFLPGHQEHFIFDAERETEHVWCSIRPTFMPADLRWRRRLIFRVCPLSSQADLTASLR